MRAPCQVFEQLLQEKEDSYHHESSSCCGNSTLQWLENELVVATLMSSPVPALKPVRTPVAIFGSLGVCIYAPASRHWLISYSLIHLT